jgi:guanylate kinase
VDQAKIVKRYLCLNPHLTDFLPSPWPLLLRRQDISKPTGDEKHWLFIGPGGSGKNTVIQKLLDQNPVAFRRGLTSTTRRPRPGEKNGRDYYFLSQKAFDRTKHLERNFFNGSWYGLPLEEWQKALHEKKITLWQIDLNGLASIKRQGYDSQLVSFFILPGSFSFLKEHYRDRENPGRRLLIARREIARAHECDYLIVNLKGKIDIIAESLSRLEKTYGRRKKNGRFTRRKAAALETSS